MLAIVSFMSLTPDRKNFKKLELSGLKIINIAS